MSEKVKERPILFNGPMVRAVLSGAKTQTRRLIKPQPVNLGNDHWQLGDKFFFDSDEVRDHLFHEVYGNKGTPYGSLYASGGDRLWVRETWRLGGVFCDTPLNYFHDAEDVMGEYLHYAADEITEHFAGQYRPSIHMPRWASRITLEITDVRVERVNEISEEDAIAEGCCTKFYPDGTPVVGHSVSEFAKLWCSIYGTDSWRQWCWVITFKRIEA